MEGRAPPVKKAKRSAPVSCLTAEESARQFPVDFYEDGGVLFCRFCEHSVDFIRVDTIKDHIKSKKHCARKNDREGASTSKQITLTTCVKSRDLREGFVLDYLKMCTLAVIPLEKTESMRPFLRKHCKQAGALPQVATLRTTYVPRLYENHFSAMQSHLHNQPVGIIADETTDIRDHSILNVLATLKGKPFLICIK